MAERVCPRDDSPPVSSELKMTPPASPSKPAHPSPEDPVPPPPSGTYIIQIPKDQVYRVPPPENAKRFERLSRRKPRRSSCCCCLCWILGLLISLILLLGIAAAVLYLVFRPEAPKYSIDSVSIKGFNLTSSAPVSPEIDVTVRADNPNNKIGIYYLSGSSVQVYYNDLRLGTGSLPVFYQGKNNVTVFTTAVKGSGIELTSADHKQLADGQSKGTVPFRVSLRAPVKIKVGSVKTWKITVKVNCDISVDKLTANSTIKSKDCDYGVNIF